MRKLLVFQHVPFEPLGLLDRMFRDAGLRIRYVNFHRAGDAQVAVDRYHGLVVLGGPMSADETDRHPHLAFEQSAIRRAIELDMPVLGICLGAQLMAASIGGRTLRGAAVELGWTRVTPTREGRADPLFRHLDAGGEAIFQWHSDTFTLPPGAIHLASSTACAYQAFRLREQAYGVQFHLEADQALIRRWVEARESVPAVAAGAAIDSEALLAATRRLIARSRELAREVFGAFVERFFKLRRRRAQPSR